MSKKKRASLVLLLFLLISGTAGLLVQYLVAPEKSDALKQHSDQRTTSSASFSTASSARGASGQRSSFGVRIPSSQLQSGLSEVSFAGTNEQVADHIDKVLAYLYENIHPETRLSYSLPGDKRLSTWSVIYDDAMRAMVHLKTGDVVNAKRTIDYFMENEAIQKIGWIKKDGMLLARSGWVVNIIDASETRPGGRGIEHIAHSGPNVFLGIASAQLYHATREKKYLSYARNRWQLVKDLQNEIPGDPNYGGVRMGPMGSPENPQEQHLDFKVENPSFYQLYNGEHAADFLGLCKLLLAIDPKNKAQYQRAADLIAIWDLKIYDRKTHLFYIGTTEVKFFEPNIDQWMGPGVMKMYPLDTTALKVNAYGVEGLDIFEPYAADKIRKAIDTHFKVTVKTKIGGSYRTVTGYDFIAKEDRKKLILFVEEGPGGDIKVNKGLGRPAMLSDEWSNWVALSDMRLAKDYLKLGEKKKAAEYWQAYQKNALTEALRTADPIAPGVLAYPYTHPIPSSFNMPVGFGWNTHHSPYSIIGGTARTMGLLGFDPFSLDETQFVYERSTKHFSYAQRMVPRASQALVTEAEEYINRAWGYVVMANRHGPNEEELWLRAAQLVEKMLSDHPDWVGIAKRQNKLAQASDEKFPLMGLAPLTPKDLEPVYRRFWALYHIGTGEFIRVMAYSRIGNLAKKQGDRKKQLEAETQMKNASIHIIQDYFYSQAYDDSNGWMWQPVNSLKEYVSPSVLESIHGYRLATDQFQDAG